MKKTVFTLWLTLVAFLFTPLTSLAQEGPTLLKTSEPFVTVKIQFPLGSADDPKDKQGLASLTALLMQKGDSLEKSHQDFLTTLYPLAAQTSFVTDKEHMTFTLTAPKQGLDPLLKSWLHKITQPAFRDQDIKKLKEKTMQKIRQDLLTSNDEELGKEILYTSLYPQEHPYHHYQLGLTDTLTQIHKKDLKSFHQQLLKTQPQVAVGGDYTSQTLAILKGHFPDISSWQKRDLPSPHQLSGRKLILAEKETDSVAISLGHPIEVNREHPDWASLWLMRSYFGEHRSSASYLFQRLRELRGLNYGDYAYIEYYPQGMFLTEPPVNVARSQQIFQIWIRPVEPKNAVFALRATLFELDKLIQDGMSQQDFERTRNFLKKYSAQLFSTTERQLGSKLDQLFYQHSSDFLTFVHQELDQLTLERVNRAIREHLSSEDLVIVLVTKDPQTLRSALEKEAPSPIRYNSPKSQSLLDEDKVIENYPLNLKTIEIRSAESFFKGNSDD